MTAQSGYSKPLRIGNLLLGGSHPLRIQSMTNTLTTDEESTLKQTKALFDLGCDMVRISVPGMKDLHSLHTIVKRLRALSYHQPVIADVHFNPKIAEEAARFVEKVRINPGNYTDRKALKAYSNKDYELEVERIADRMYPLIQICKENGTALRIGANHGSLSSRIMTRYGNTAEGMVESALEFVRICCAFDFHNIVLSMKSSNVQVMNTSNRLLVKKMEEEKMFYPIHLGVTEAGAGLEGRLRSAAGIGPLLLDGIGDTIRVSLSENPLEEIPFAKAIACLVHRQTTNGNIHTPSAFSVNEEIRKPVFVVTSGPNEQTDYFAAPDNALLSRRDGKSLSYKSFSANELKNIYPESIKSHAVVVKMNNEPQMIDINAFNHLMYKNKPAIKRIIRFEYPDSSEATIAHFAMYAASAIMNGRIDGLWLDMPENPASVTLALLQSIGNRISSTEYISCPTCGRTHFDLPAVLSEVKAATSKYKGLKIAVMGCIVNGPGEMADADYGFVGAGKDKVNIYKGKTIIYKNINHTQALDILVLELEKHLQERMLSERSE